MEIVLVVGLIVAALAAGTVLRLLSSRERPSLEPRHRVVVATATTADGVTAHLQATYVLTVLDAQDAGPGPDEFVDTQLGSRLRHLIAERLVGELPITGESVDDLIGDGLPGVRIEHVTVASTDVVVSPELRRLVRVS
ncbi:hypothetical protein [Nocardioides currus]|uniref:Uncharacterized protein n=1 Tax=Nocardioides currus TaxID=2133958 RepID=A0A2R7YUF8_9ACTN|nr:hypothetical protein [Nocardioides currus]PUA80050.1 hypothetical protein C7S10_15965 [Nocardioides currus]